jgi:hypothetical protein
MSEDTKKQFGWLAKEFGSRELPLKVCESAAGLYLGTEDKGEPYTRESVEYWRKRKDADKALLTPGTWTQRLWL